MGPCEKTSPPCAPPSRGGGSGNGPGPGHDGEWGGQGRESKGGGEGAREGEREKVCVREIGGKRCVFEMSRGKVCSRGGFERRGGRERV